MPKAIFVAVFALLSAWPHPASTQPARARPADPSRCAAVTVNHDCLVAIDREDAVSPLPVRVDPRATVIIRVSKRPFEQIVIQTATVETPPSDPLAAVFAALLPSLKEFVGRTGTLASPAPPASVPERQLSEDGRAVRQTLSELGVRQQRVEDDLAAFDARVRLLATDLLAMQRRRAGQWEVEDLERFRQRFSCAVRAFGVGRETQACREEEVAAIEPLPTGVLKVLDEKVVAATRAYAKLPETDQQALGKELDAVAGGQERLSSRVKSLAAAKSALSSAAGSLEDVDPAQLSTFDDIPFGGAENRRTRTATVKIAAHDLVSKTMTPLGAVVINWGATRWELSTGALFSTVVSSTFQHSPVVENGVPKVDASGDSVTVITESQTKPTVVPAVLVHVRLAEKAVSQGSRRLAFLWALAVGVNPYSGSADFGAGVTFSYRGLALSPMAHAARPLRLTNGLQVGQEFAGSHPTLTTERYWAVRFALGISYRVPIK